MKRRVYRFLLQPRSSGRDQRRQELILNVLLAGLLGIASLALAASLATMAAHQNDIGPGPVVVTALFLLAVVAGRAGVRAGYIRTVSYVLVSLLLISTSRLMVVWGFNLPQVVLNYVLVSVIAGILLGARAGLKVTALAMLLIIGGGWAHVHGLVQPDTVWRQREPLLIDAIGYALVVGLVGLVSWLSSREIDRSLHRARASEAALQQERDSLERKVAERTRELSEAHMLRLLELERLNMPGHITTALLHDLANPVMAANLHMQLLSPADQKKLAHVATNLARLDQHMRSARQQIRGDEPLRQFSPGREAGLVADMLQPYAAQQGVQLDSKCDNALRLYGSADKFSRIVQNLVNNAIDAYELSFAAHKVVHIRLRRSGPALEMTVRDHGRGIKPPDVAHIFEAFYSHKPNKQHMGIGLSTVKYYVEQHFNGSITVTSPPGQGTCFVLLLRDARAD